MISLFAFEIKKLIRSRSFLLLFAFLISANLLICFISSTNENSENEYAALIQEHYAESGYKQDINRVISSAESSLKSNLAAGYAENGYVCSFQKQVMETYSENIDISISKELVIGWDKLIFYNFDFVLLVALVLFSVPFLLLQDDNNSTRAVVRATKNGRVRLFATRLSALLVVTSLAELTFFATTVLVIVSTNGFSSFGASAQSIQDLALSPFNVSVAGAAAIMLCMKSVALLIVLAVSVIMCCVFCNSVFAMLGCSVFIGLSYIASTFDYINVNTFSNVINVFSLSNGEFFLKRLYGINLFDSNLNPIAVAVWTLTVLFCLLPIAYSIYANKNANSKIKPFEFKLPAPKSIAAFELKKIFTTGIGVILVLLACTKIGIAVHSYYFDNEEDTIYRTYMDALAGPITEEKKAYIAKEKMHIYETLMQRSTYDAMFDSDMISEEEYESFLKEYHLCTFKEQVLPEIEERAEYIEENGNTPWFVYDNGYNRLFSAEADYLCLLIVILLGGDLFAKEYSTGMFKIISATKNGRGKVTHIKLISALSFVFVFTGLFNLVDYLWISLSFSLPMWNAPICSLPQFCEINQFTIGEYFALSLAYKVVQYLCFAVIVITLSNRTENHFYTVVSSIGICCVPHIAYLLGIKTAGFVSLPLMLSVSGYTSSFGIELFGIASSILLLVAMILLYSIMKNHSA